MFGVDLYSRFLWKRPYLSDIDINNKETWELHELERISKDNTFWHLKSIMANACIFIPISIFIYKYELFPISPKQIYTMNCNPRLAQQITKNSNNHILIGILGASGLLLFNGIYGILANSYNRIRINIRLNLVKYGAIESIVEEQLMMEKQIWNMFEMIDGHSKTYVIHNQYYTNLIFFFENKNVADRIKNLLDKLPVKKIDWMNDNAATIRDVQRKILKDFCE